MNRPAEIDKNDSKTNEVITLLSAQSDELYRLKNDLSSIFSGIGSFLLDTSRELFSFNKIIKPYIDYFYPINADERTECFMNDVIVPSKKEMEETIGLAVFIMQDDSKVNGEVVSAIDNTMAIQKIVSQLLVMIEAIETYSWNSMLISNKAGQRGQALATISGQLSSLSHIANITAGECSKVIEEINSKYESFQKIRDKIEMIKENYLTAMSAKSSMMFREIVVELENLSSSVRDILGFSASIDSVMGDLMERLQREDLVRQDIEKILLLSEEFRIMNEDQKFQSEAGAGLTINSLEAAFLPHIERKLNIVHGNLQNLREGVEQFTDNIKDIINLFINRFYGTENSPSGGYYEGSRFNEICSRFQSIKDEYVKYFEEIISYKKELYRLSREIVKTVSRFGVLFSEMEKIARRFEIINMLTKIELAKHSDLHRSIGVSLLAVSDLPAQMKKIIDEAFHEYRLVIAELEESLSRYKSNHQKEEQTLFRCIEAMKKISVKLFESQKYYRDISEKIGSTGMGMLTFLETRSECYSAGSELVNVVYNLAYMVNKNKSKQNTSLSTNYGLQKDIMGIYTRLFEAGRIDSGRMNFIKSIFAETEAEETKEKVLVF